MLTIRIQQLVAQIESIRNAKDDPEGKTIFHKLLRSNIPDSDKSTERLSDEALILVLAGSETTATSMITPTYYLLSSPPMLKRLKAELETVMPDPNQLPESSKLDGLPFLVRHLTSRPLLLSSCLTSIRMHSSKKHFASIQPLPAARIASRPMKISFTRAQMAKRTPFLLECV
jgi:cytochrome P450